MSTEALSEDQTVLAAIEALEWRAGAPDALDAPASRSDEASETLSRLYIEMLGIIPFELDPAHPSPEARKRLMAVVRGDETQEVREPAPPTNPEPIRLTSIPTAQARPETPPRPVPVRPAPSPARTTGEMRAVRLTPPPMAAGARRRSPSRWPLALAASLAVLLAGLSVWLYLQTAGQQKRIVNLEQQLVMEQARARQAVAQAQQRGGDGLREKFDLITSPAVAVMPMRPAGPALAQPRARGVLYVAADHQHWFFSCSGLDPAPAGKVYKLWFEADAGISSGGHFTARPGVPMELSSEQMPAGTRGVTVTLEDDPQAPAPSGPEILRAQGIYQLS